MTNFKLNLKGQFNNSQTAVNPTEVGPATVSRQSRLMSVLCLLALLALGEGQMWGECSYNGGNNISFNNCHFYFNPYYDATNSINKGTIQLAVRKYQYDNCDPWGWYTGVTNLTAVTNTRLYYASTLEGVAWTDDHKRFHGWAIISNSSAKSNGETEYWSGNNSTWYSDFKAYGLNSGNTYLFRATSATKGNTIETTGTGYLSSGVNDLNKTIIVKAKVSTNDGNSYSEATSPGTLSASSKKFTAHNTCNTSTSLSSNTITCGYTATTTLTAPSTDPTGYTWVGWYNASGTQQTTSKTLTIYPTEDATYYAYYKANQYTGTINANGGAENKSYTATYSTTTLTIETAPTRTGYNLSGYYKEAGCTNLIASSSKALQANTTYTNSSKQWTYTSAPTLYAGWTAKQTTITLNSQDATTAGSTSVTATYDAAMPAITLPEKTGYTFGGYWGAPSGSGPQYYNADGSSTQNWNNESNTYTLYAKWTPKNYTITLDLDQANKGNTTGATTSQSVTYNGATTTVPALPHAADGYGLYGYYTLPNGEGTKLINGDGTWIASVTDYTDANKKWIHDGDINLYAYYRQAAITGFTFDAATVAPGGTVGVRPIIDPVPEGTTFICWEIQYSNGNPLDPQPTDLAYTDGKLTFTASETSGTYKVEATLHLGADCEGTVLSTAVQNFQVAGDHTVTVQYKCGSETIKPSTTVTGKPLEWSEEITPPDIFGYTFLRWVAEDGVSITTNNGSTTVDSTTTSTIRIKANYNGRLLARYTQKQIIYFKNTLGWSNVYVNLLDGDYWGSDGNANKGTGNKNKANKNLAMTRIGETDVWYYEYGNKSTTQYVSFTQESMDNYEFFSQNSLNVAHVVFPTRNSDALTTNKNNDNGFYAGTPMFVPRAGQTGVKQNNNRAEYYNDGYWTKYTPGTGYILRIYNNAGNTLLKTIEFTSADELMPMTAVVDLEATKTYKYELMREGDVYYGNDNTMTFNDHGQGTPWEMTWKNGGHKAGLTTNAAGDYTFHLTYSAHSNQYRLRMAVDYPIKNGDYRVIYKDGEHTNWHPSAIVPQVNNGKDTVSFFIRPGNAYKQMKIQQATVADNGAITWSAGTDITSELTSARCPKDSVYNICLKMDGTGAISVENVEGYTGNYYIRTDAANNKWDNYKSADHMMTYSEYSERNSDYTHYWMTHVWANTNVKFVVANDYSPCISDTLVTSSYRGGDASHIYVSTPGHGDGDIKVEANIRFMWNKNNNAVYRAYLSGGKEDGSKFLVLRGTDSDNIKSQGGEALTGDKVGDKVTPGNNHGAGAHCMQFTDDENWIYETTVQVLPSSYVKLYALFNGSNFYYKGEDNNTFDGNDGDSDGIPNAIQLITGDGSSYLTVRVIYDFKTDRLLAALLPEGNIDDPMPIHADVMFIREHQEDIAQLTFTDDGKITEIKTAYAVMRFNKWTLNNKNKDTHAVLPSPLSRYERDVFYVSFPFDVNLNEVFGFGTYGVHWIMEYYDGAARAANGFWKDTPSYWRFITNRNGYVLKKNVGYILALDLDELGEESSVWANNNERAELFFPSSGTMPDIKSGTVTAKLDEHTCTIVRNGSDRTKADSHWNIMGVPTYINTTNISYANTEWTNKIGPKFLYTWNSADNTLTPTTATGFTYHAMHAYTVQYCGNVTWTTSVSPPSIVARQKQEPSAYEWCLELQQNDQMTDRTYVRMSDEEEVTSGFEFGYDMSKSMNRDKANIYTFIGSETVAGNSLPLQTEQTTVVPVGVTIKNAGEYTFAMPDGTNGVGVTLVDTEANIRTSLSALDYTVSLEAGEYTGRFVLEISPIQNTPTDLGNVQGDNVQGTKARKVMVDGILYIVKDGKMYDARGARVE